MRLFIFYPFVNAFGGIERLIVDLYIECQALDISVNLVCFRNRINFEEYGATNLRVVELSGRRSFLAEWARLRRFFGTRSATDAVLVMELCGVAYAGAIVGPYALHIADTPQLLSKDITKYSWSARCMPNEESKPGLLLTLKGEAAFRLIRRGIRLASTRLTMTNRNSEELKRIFNKPFEYVWPGVAEFSGHMAQESNVCMYLSVCRLEPSKRVDWIIRAFQSMSLEARQHARLVIVGEGSTKPQLQRSASLSDVADRIVFPGHVSEQELEWWFQQSSVFVMPAKQGYGLPGLEALLRGLRIIVHEESGVSELLTNCDRAMIIYDETSLQAAMEAFYRTHKTYLRTSLTLQSRGTWVRQLLGLCGWISR